MRSLLLFTTLLLLAGCARKNLAVGSICDNNEQCATGLACLEIGMFGADGGSCTVVGKACTIVCTTDTDCAHLPDNAQCFESCTGPSTCEPTFSSP